MSRVKYGGTRGNQETYLFTLPTPHRSWLSVFIVDVSPKIFCLRHGRRFGFLHSFIYFSLGDFIKSLIGLLINWYRRNIDGTDLEFLFRGEPPFLNIALKASNGILRAPHPLHLFASTICCSGVRHATQSISTLVQSHTRYGTHEWPP